MEANVIVTRMILNFAILTPAIMQEAGGFFSYLQFSSERRRVGVVAVIRLVVIIRRTNKRITASVIRKVPETHIRGTF